MEHYQILQRLLPGCTFFNADTTPDNISFIYTYFEKAVNHIIISGEKNPELILFHDPFNKFDSRYIELNGKEFVLISLTQISMVSQLMELFFFGYVDQNLDLSFFLGNLSNYHTKEGSEYSSNLKNTDSNQPDLTLFFRFEGEENRQRKEYFEKIHSNEFTALLGTIDSFYNILEFYIIYLIVHELNHYYKDAFDVKALNFSSLRHQSNDRYVSYFENQFDYYSSEKLDEPLYEELTCDIKAYMLAHKTSNLFIDYDEFFYLMFAPFFYNSLLLGRESACSLDHFENLLIRKSYMALLIKFDLDFEPTVDAKVYHNAQLIEYIDIGCMSIIEDSFSFSFENTLAYKQISNNFSGNIPIKRIDRIAWARNWAFTNIFKRL